MSMFFSGRRILDGFREKSVSVSQSDEIRNKLANFLFDPVTFHLAHDSFEWKTLSKEFED